MVSYALRRDRWEAKFREGGDVGGCHDEGGRQRKGGEQSLGGGRKSGGQDRELIRSVLQREQPLRWMTTLDEQKVRSHLPLPPAKAATSAAAAATAATNAAQACKLLYWFGCSYASSLTKRNLDLLVQCLSVVL